PRGLCLAGGISGSTIAHCSSVRSEGYTFLRRLFGSICAYSSADGICANYPTNLLFCQLMFPDSLLVIIMPWPIRNPVPNDVGVRIRQTLCDARTPSSIHEICLRLLIPRIC